MRDELEIEEYDGWEGKETGQKDKDGRMICVGDGVSIEYTYKYSGFIKKMVGTVRFGKYAIDYLDMETFGIGFFVEPYFVEQGIHRAEVREFKDFDGKEVLYGLTQKLVLSPEDLSIFPQSDSDHEALFKPEG